MATIKERQLELLEETVQYYSKNPVERRCKVEGNCSYSPKTVGKTKSSGCAIGRKLKPSVREEIDRRYPNGASVDDCAWQFIPENLKELGKAFLKKVQNLHDNDYYWMEHNISESGKVFVDNIKQQFNLN